MVGIVVVSHSRALARAAVELASEMLRDRPIGIAVAAGLDDTTLGTDAVAVADAITSVDSPDGVVVLLDLGSAVLSAELALELLPDDVRDRVILSPAPLVEGLVAAVVTAAGGATSAEVAAEAANSLADKNTHLGGLDPAPSPPPAATASPAATTSPATAPAPARDPADRVTTMLVVDLPHGLHARPAANLVSTVRNFDAEVTLARPGGVGVSARSLSRIAALGIRSGESVDVAASGPEAAAVVEALLALAGRHFDETPETAAAPAPTTSTAALTSTSPTSPTTASAAPTGAPHPVTVVAGVALGPAFLLGDALLDRHTVRSADARWTAAGGTAADARARLLAAVDVVRTEVRRTAERTRTLAGREAAAIFEAHLLLLDDDDLQAAALALIEDGAGPAHAWSTAVGAAAGQLSDLTDDYLRGRAADVLAIGAAVVAALGATEDDEPAAATEPPAGIVVAADLTPAEAADLDPSTVTGVVLAGGSPTAHAAILVRSLGIPMIVGAGPGVLEIASGTLVGLDAGAARVVVDPGPDAAAEFRTRIAAQVARAAELAGSAAEPAVTTDGTAVVVAANIGSVADAVAAAAAGAEGSGLVRTEFCFTGRAVAPTAAEQEAVYEGIAAALHPHRVVFRTMDVGGDKPLAFLPMPAEANPFLGVRGLRLSLLRPDLLRDQLAALLAVAARHPVSIMFPMVTTLDELLAARAVLDEVAAAAGGPPADLRVGMMVEVPGAAVKAAVFAPHVDFFSIGTNDLTQYTLAAERGNDALSALADALDPGVLGLIDGVCRGATKRPGEPVLVAVCGEAAADPAAAVILLGLGVRELSVSGPAVAAVKDLVRRTDLGAAVRLATAALGDPGAAAVRARSAAPTPAATGA